jgi:hypothetical protein
MLVRKGVHREELAPISGALTVDPLELGRVSQTHSLATGQRLYCQTLAAPAPTVSDYPAPAHRVHAFAEAVGLGPLTAIWLISTLHRTPLYRYSEVFSRPSRVYPKPATPSSNLGSKFALANTRHLDPSYRKMLQNGVYSVHVPRDAHHSAGPEVLP